MEAYTKSKKPIALSQEELGADQYPTPSSPPLRFGHRHFEKTTSFSIIDWRRLGLDTMDSRQHDLREWQLWQWIS